MAKRYSNSKEGDKQNSRKNWLIDSRETPDARKKSSEKNSVTFLKETACLVHEMNEHRKKLNRNKVRAILNCKKPTSSKETITSVKALQYIANHIPKLSKKNQPNDTTIKK